MSTQLTNEREFTIGDVSTTPSDEIRNREDGYARRRQRGTGRVDDMEAAWYTYLAIDESEDLFKEIRQYAYQQMREKLTVDDPDDPTGKRTFQIGTSKVGGPDDYAQEIAALVWQKLPKFEGTYPEFRVWLKNICINYRARAKEDVAEDKYEQVPLQVEIDNDGEPETIDNPLLYLSSGYAFKENLPASIEGEDREICTWINDGKTYAEVGERVGLTEAAVKQRVYRIRGRMREERQARRERVAAKDTAERERQTYRARQNRDYIDAIYARLKRDDE
jgi:DNA-directed RNA polymerase specialized sigma24 family protein